MTDHDRLERDILPHLPAAYALARWLTNDPHDAEDVVQEAILRAMRFVDGCRGTNVRAWILTIVRHAAYDWLRRYRPQELIQMPDELPDAAQATGPDAALLADERRTLLRQALAQLPLASREVLLLREIEGLSYLAIAELVQVPIGTVMSRLSRARDQLAALVSQHPIDGRPATGGP